MIRMTTAIPIQNENAELSKIFMQAEPLEWPKVFCEYGGKTKLNQLGFTDLPQYLYLAVKPPSTYKTWPVM